MILFVIGTEEKITIRCAKKRSPRVLINCALKQSRIFMGKLRHWGAMPVKLPFNYGDRSLKCRSKVPPQKCLYLKMIRARVGYDLTETSVCAQ